MAEKCGKCYCDAQIKDDLKCAECNLLFHQKCVRPTAGDKVSTRKTWKCDGCASENSSTSSKVGTEQHDAESASGTILDAIAAFRRESTDKWDQSITKLSEVQADLKRVTEDIVQLKMQFESVKNESKLACESVELIKAENKRLKDKMLAMSKEINDIQQYTRINNLIISGIPVTRGEDVYSILAHLAQLMSLTFFKEEISVAHRLTSYKGSKQPPSIVVNFVTRSAKARWVYARRQRRRMTANELQEDFPNNTIYFNEHLTQHTRELLNAARDLLKNKQLAYVWTSDCKVLVKKTDKGKTWRIQQLEDIQQLMAPLPHDSRLSTSP